MQCGQCRFTVTGKHMFAELIQHWKDNHEQWQMKPMI